ncbi:hypothetical protein BD770DRAFT_315244 [Pilaira anomala]|nr:hypothetical protein BD770DRAFT_315244 [Pilaira anomala]
MVKTKIEKLGKSDNTRREELKEQLDQIRERQSEIKQSRKPIYDQLEALNDSIKKKVGTVKSFQSKVPFKSTNEVDERIRELEIQLERGVRLVEEKKIFQEISILKRGRTQVEGVTEQQEAIEKERALYNDLRKNVDDGENKRLSDKYELLNTELKTLITEAIKQREERTKLFDERTRLKTLLDDAYQTLRTSRDEHRKAKHEYYIAVREAQEKRRELDRLEKIKLEAEKREEIARQELELASIPAYQHEIVLCDNLAAFLKGFITKAVAAAAAAATTTTTSTTSTTGQQEVVDQTSITEDLLIEEHVPEGFVIKKKENDEVYFMGGKTKKKPGVAKAPKEKKSDILKLPLATMEDFFDVKVTVPTKISEVPATLEKLNERKLAYFAEQPKIAEENLKRAQEKIAAMTTTTTTTTTTPAIMVTGVPVAV